MDLRLRPCVRDNLNEAVVESSGQHPVAPHLQIEFLLCQTCSVTLRTYNVNLSWRKLSPTLNIVIAGSVANGAPFSNASQNGFFFESMTLHLQGVPLGHKHLNIGRIKFHSPMTFI
jgi:hypothetical protein